MALKPFKSRRKRTAEEVEAIRQQSTVHGYNGKAGVWKTWNGIVQRITNPKSKDFPNYGGRGLDMDPRWRFFVAFLADMGDRPKETTIGRIDNDRGYWPDNCRWETLAEQNNNRRSSRFVEFEGQRMTVAQAARVLGITRQAMRYRLEAGWDVATAFSAKDQGRAKRKETQCLR